MLRLRFTGLGSREIAAQLNLPPRLVHQTLTVLRERREFLSDGQEHGA
jgi:hypothetical protein